MTCNIIIYSAAERIGRIKMLSENKRSTVLRIKTPRTTNYYYYYYRCVGTKRGPINRFPRDFQRCQNYCRYYNVFFFLMHFYGTIQYVNVDTFWFTALEIQKSVNNF